MIQRNYYLNRLIRNMWNGEIKVITGIRRCGKSVLLFELFDEYLRNHGTDATQIIKIELDQRRYYKYRNPITLCEYVEQLVLGQQDKKGYLEKMVVFDLSSRFKSKSTLFLLVVFCSITGILY